MRVVVALGGNALLRRGQQMTVENQRANVAVACEHLAPVAAEHQLVISHGNGPQIGLLALEGAAYEDEVPAYPLDVLGAESQGMIGYLIEQELRNRMPFDRPLSTLLTTIEVDPDDPAFADPTKPIGPQYSAEQAAALQEEHGWTFRPDGDHLRRVVASPAPKRILQRRQIAWLLERDSVVICAGGGGIPTTRRDGRFEGVEAVIDKDHASSLLARDLGADVLVMATDVPAVYVGFGTDQEQAVIAADPSVLIAQHADELATGSMRPKVLAACDFARSTGYPAMIGRLADIEHLVAGIAGTRISTDVDGVVTADSHPPAGPPLVKEH